MSVTSKRKVVIFFTGDFVASNEYEAAENTASPAKRDIVTLSSGANTITPPTGGATAKAVTIIPPSGNEETITLKGVTGDTGVVLSPTEPTTIALNSAVDTFVLTASASIIGVQLIWT